MPVSKARSARIFRGVGLGNRRLRHEANRNNGRIILMRILERLDGPDQGIGDGRGAVLGIGGNNSLDLDGFGDVAVIHTFSLHRSEHNLSRDRTRLVQLFRYADLNQPAAAALGWASVPPRDQLGLFGRTHPDKLALDALAPSPR